jgi:putative Mg2+ transporter-C (MgtC) family protein
MSPSLDWTEIGIRLLATVIAGLLVGYNRSEQGLRRGSMVVGVTTAATLWLVTVIGLCLGGGQLALGAAATALGLLALWVLKWLEAALPRGQRAMFEIETDATGPGEADIRQRLRDAGLAITGVSIAHAGPHRKFAFKTYQVCRPWESETPEIMHRMALEPGVTGLKWRRDSDME